MHRALEVLAAAPELAATQFPGALPKSPDHFPAFVASPEERFAVICSLKFEELMRLAVFRLEVERELGAQVAETVNHSRRRQLSSEGTFDSSDLPDGMTRISTRPTRVARPPDCTTSPFTRSATTLPHIVNQATQQH